MDSIKLEQLITENMKSIFGFALTRLGNVAEAEYLASDILYEIIRSAPNLKDEERFYGFIWKIAENVYMDYLRKNAEYVGAFVYRFYSIEKLVSKLFEMDWIKAVGDNEKPAVFVVRN